MGRKKNYIEMFDSFTEPFNLKGQLQSWTTDYQFCSHSITIWLAFCTLEKFLISMQ